MISAIFGQFLDLIDYVENSPRLSPVDSFLCILYRSIPWRINHDGRKIAKKVLERFVLSLSDQQLVTGIAILSAGWIRHSKEKVYDFQMITDLAWMSSNTHLLAVGFLRDYFKKHQDTRYWRLTIMGCNFVLLFVANIYTGELYWFDDFAYPAQCDFDAINHDPSWIAGQPARYMYSSMALLLYGYVRGLVPLFPGLWQPVAAWLKDHIRRRMDRWFDHGTRYHRRLLHSHRTRAVELARMLPGVMLALYEISYTAIHMGIYVIASDAWSVLIIQSFWYVYGNWWIWSDRNYAQTYMEGEENKWGFGQLVPLLLIGLPLLSSVGNYYGV